MGCGFLEACASNALATVFVDYLVKPTVSHLGYVFRFNKIVEDLREHSNQLSSKQESVKKDVKEAKNQIQEINKEVKDWQKDALKVQQDVQSLEVKIQENKSCCFNWCPNLSWRYRLSKQAAEKSLAISNLMKSEFQRVGHPADLLGLRFLPSKEFLVSKSAELAEGQIMEALKDDGVNIIGVWGMGGIGKTTLVNEVGRKAKESKLFGEVVNVVVSQNPNIEKIQDKIAELSNLRLDKKTEDGKAEQLWIGLLEKKSVLIILDDLWKELDLKAVGIPIGEHHKGCKILLTTRSHKVCSDMTHKRSGRVVKLDGLKEDEAWKLFKMSAALDDDSTSPGILKVAAEVVEECNGLPIAISTLGKALKDASISGWRDACRKLKSSRLPDIPCVEEDKNAYKCLKFSYDFLRCENTKTCFLLCSLYPEDFEIPVEGLVRHVWGLNIFQGSKSIQEARDTVHATLDHLKASCLLLDGWWKHHVRMHDMVRDVALWIASQKENHVVIKSEVGASKWPGNENFEAYTAISFMECKMKEIPMGLEYPKLELLSFTTENIEETLTIAGASFEGMKSLKVLNLKLNGSLSNDAPHFLTNLRTLCLVSCKLNTYSISSLGELKKLEILDFFGSDIEVLPDEVGDLKSLRLLDLSYCMWLKKIPPNVIQRLSQLEELYLGRCGFDDWLNEGTDAEGKNASLLELNKLSQLAILVLRVGNPMSFPKNLVFPKLQNYSIAIESDIEEVYPSKRCLRVNDFALFNAFKNLFEDVELLELGGFFASCQNIVPSLYHGALNSLSILRASNCDMECLVDARDQHEQVAFSNLLVLEIKSLYCFERLCKSPPPNGFLKKLESLEIERCHKVTSLFPSSVMQSLLQLKSLKIADCNMLELIFEEIQIEDANEVLQKLLSLKVTHCSSLKSIFQRSVAQNLVRLKSLEIGDCNMLVQIFEEIEGANEALQNLQSLEVTHSSNLKSLFPPSVAQNLVQLKSLKIVDCNRLEQIFEIEGANEALQKLQSLKVTHCSSLKSLFPLSVAQNLVQLESLEIGDCNMLVQIFEEIEGGKGEILSTTHAQTPYLMPKLKTLEICGCSGLNLECLIDTRNVRRTTGIALSNLEKLVLEDMTCLKWVCNGESPQGFLQKLQNLKMKRCRSMTCLFPWSFAQYLVQLKVLEIEECDMLERLVVEAADFEMLSNNPHHFSCLQQLYSLQISKCCKLKYIFPSSLGENLNLPQLKGLYLENLDQLKEVVAPRQGRDGNDILLKLPSLHYLRLHDCPILRPFSVVLSDQMGGISIKSVGGSNPAVAQWKQNSPNMEYAVIGNNAEEMFQLQDGTILSNLWQFELSHLPELRVIWRSPNQVVTLQNLYSLTLTDCKRLRYVFSPMLAPNLPQLRFLNIDGCEKLEQIVDTSSSSSSSQDRDLQPLSFSNLNSIEIKGCNSLKYVFPVSILPHLQQLHCIRISEASKLEQVFGFEDKGDAKDHHHHQEEQERVELSVFELYLKELPSLTSFSTVDYNLIFPYWMKLEVTDCPRMTTFPLDSQHCTRAQPQMQASQSIENSVAAQVTTWPRGSNIK